MSRKKSPRASKGFPQAVKRRHIFDSFAARLNVVPFPILARPEFVSNPLERVPSPGPA
jgi:hypothetical protein